MSKIFMLYFLVLLIIQPVLAQQTTFSINSIPSQSWVRVDSVLVGRTPLTDIRVDAGRHIIHVAPPKGGVWNYEDKFIEIFVSGKQDTVLSVLFDKPVFINSIPYGAHLRSNHEHIGITPLYVPFESNSGAAFQIIKEGYEPYEFILEEPEPIIAKLQKKKGYTEQENKKPRFFGLMPKRHAKSKFTLLALTVAAHWTSFYLKNVADEKYDDYLRTANPQQMHKYWDETKKYDRFSEISLGVSYVALTGLIYMVIWH